ncbi:hypothetical protein RHMOL_Rhmol04G0296600 [Rhododendron molle]|uniref:Uncharacterized protein n=1 Tax=Rhododendron molle TaxID=49168 RepID=A0ACC0P6W6_RHOML|nr:hypothetical protein RHMOL_Rhmol04G0296600 [Rhododendron molle]
MHGVCLPMPLLLYSLCTVRGQRIDKRDVVPYNAYLSRKYNSHINVEVCLGIKSVKYIHKYIYKSHDHTMMVLRDE